jgi:hypothetical protein
MATREKAGEAIVLDAGKIYEAVLALLHLPLHDGARLERLHWGALDRLHEKGMICEPAGW